MKIIIETVPHMSQRYNTIGDWQWNGDTLNIKVSEMGDWRKEFLVGIHEVIETMLCKYDGVTEQQVDDFDLGNPQLYEPGEDPRAPYFKQHAFAIEIETMLMNYLNVDQDEYEGQMEDMQILRNRNEDKN